MEKNKEEFLRELKQALSGQVPPEAVKENLRYYEDYFRSEIRGGRTERQVMEELGEARLIARTIIDATPGGGKGAFEEYDANIRDDGPSLGQEGKGFSIDFRKWYGKALLLVTVILTLAIVFMVIGGILTLVIPLIPVIILGVFGLWLWEKMSRR